MFIARIFTLYPELFPGPFGCGLFGKGLQKKIWGLEKVNIRKYAEDLLEEKWTALQIREQERRNRRIVDGTGNNRETKLETISASGINTEQIYDGERIEKKT